MYAMMALYDSDLRDELFTLMELSEIKNYTQFRGLSGSSHQGKKENSVAWPGSNEIVLLIMNDQEKEKFKKNVEEFKSERNPKPGLLVFDWQLAEVV